MQPVLTTNRTRTETDLNQLTDDLTEVIWAR